MASPAVRRAPIVVATALALVGFASTLIAHDGAQAAVYDGVALATAVLAFEGARRLPVGRRRPWYFVAAGCLAFFVGNVIWDVYEFVGGEQAPIPSVADAAYLASYPFIILGLAHLIRWRTNVDRVNATAEAAAVAVSVTIFLWQPLLLKVAPGVVGPLIAAAYPVADVALIGTAAILVGARRRMSSSIFVLVGGVLLLVADLTYLLLEANDAYTTGSAPDLLFVLAPLLFALAPWYDNADAASDLVDRRRPSPMLAVGIVVASLLCLPLDLVLSAGSTPRRYETLARVLLRIALLSIVALRLLRETHNNQRLLTAVGRTSTRLSTIINNTADAVIFTDVDGVILEWNDAASSLFRRGRADVLGTNVFELIPTGDLESLRMLARATPTGGTAEESVLSLNLDGQTVPVTFRISSVADENGYRVGYVALAQDDTRRHLAARAIFTLSSLDPSHATHSFAEALHAFIPFDMMSLSSVDGETLREIARVNVLFADGGARFADTAADELVPLPYTSASPLRKEPYVLVGDGDDMDVLGAVGMREAITVPIRDEATREVTAALTVAFAVGDDRIREYADELARLAPHLARPVENMVLFEEERRVATASQTELDVEREERQRAGNVQRALLPTRLPRMPNFDLAAKVQPSLAVGGDFFDWYPATGGTAVAVVDVMGKGMAGALLMATIRAALRNTPAAQTVAERLATAAAGVQEDLDQTGSFFTAFLAEASKVSNTVSYVDAGHGLAIVARNNGSVERLTVRGLPVGLVAGSTWPIGEVALEPGDSLVVCSDGVLDAHAPADTDEDVTRILTFVGATVAGCPTAQAAVDELTNLSHVPDDVTVLVLRRM